MGGPATVIFDETTSSQKEIDALVKSGQLVRNEAKGVYYSIVNPSVIYHEPDMPEVTAFNGKTVVRPARIGATFPASVVREFQTKTKTGHARKQAVLRVNFGREGWKDVVAVQRECKQPGDHWYEPKKEA